MFFIGLIIFYLALFLLCAILFSSREGYWSPVTLFGITAFYYYLSLPLELYARGNEIFATYPALFLITDETRIRIAISAILALSGFVIGHHLSGLGQKIKVSCRRTNIKLPKSLLWLLFGSFLILFLVYGSTLFEKLSYHEATERRSNDFFFGFITKNCLILIGLLAGTLVQQSNTRRLYALLLISPVVLWGFYTSDKNPLLVAGISISTIWVGQKSRSPKYLYLYCFLATLAVVGLPLFSAIRAEEEVRIGAAFTDFSVEQTDARGPLMSLSAAMANEEEMLYGKSYVQGLVAWIPRIIWLNRPVDLAQDFAQNNIPNWHPGMGLGYSLLAEGYVNFGYIGVFCHYLILALAMGWLWRFSYGIFASTGGTAYWRALMVVVYFQLIVLMHRGSISQVIQINMHEYLIPFALYWILDHKRNLTKTGRNSFSKSFHKHRSIRLGPTASL